MSEVDEILDKVDKGSKSFISEDAKKKAFSESQIKQYLGMLSLLPKWGKVMLGFLLLTIIIGLCTEIYLLYSYTNLTQWLFFIATLILIKIYNRFEPKLIKIYSKLKSKLIKAYNKFKNKFKKKSHG